MATTPPVRARNNPQQQTVLGLCPRPRPSLRGAGGDVAGQFVFADSVFEGGLEDRVHVHHRRRGQLLLAALADGAAPISFGVQALGAALAGGAEPVEEGAYVLGGEAGDLLGAEAGDEVEADAGGVAGVGVLAEPVDGDAAEPVGQIVADGAVGGGDRETAVAVGDLLGEFVGGFTPRAAVDADAFAGAAWGEGVSDGFPTAVFALETVPPPVGADAVDSAASSLRLCAPLDGG
ncbi:hypothetical protein GCM10019017_54810 [Streptomyces showdoensis]